MTLSSIIDNYYSLGWYNRAAVIFAVASLIIYIISIVISRLHKSFDKGNHFINKVILTSVRPPLYFLIVAISFSMFFQIVATEFKWPHRDIIGDAKAAVVVVSIVWVLIRLIGKIESHLATLIKSKGSKLDRTSLGALTKVAYVTVFVLAILISMESWGFNLSGIIAFGSISGIIMGFASKDILANFLGAMTIYLDQPFKVGNWIKLQEKNIEGTVEKIGLRCTVIRSSEKKPIYIPNSIFSQIPIENASQMSHQLINETFGIRHEDFQVLERILQDLNLMLAENVYVDKKQICTANFTGFTATSVNITIICFTQTVDTSEFYSVKEKLLIAAANIVGKHEAKMAQLNMVKSPMLP